MSIIGSVNENNDGQDAEIKLNCDFRVVFIVLRSRLLYVLLASCLVFGVAWGVIRYIKRNSMSNWTSSAKLFHQGRSEKSPAYYKQLDTKSIAELVTTKSTMRRAHQKIKEQCGDIPLSFDQVTVGISKNKNNIILISADYNRPEIAAIVANAVADSGVEEYVELQNGTLKKMLMERRRRLTQLNAEIERLESERSQYVSPQSTFSPDQELARVQLMISGCMTRQVEYKSRYSELSVKRQEVLRNLSTVDKEVQSTHKIHGGEDAELDQLRKNLVRMEHQYTDKNPRVLAMRAELKEREEIFLRNSKKQNSDEIIFSLNEVYQNLQDQLVQTDIALKVLEKSINDNQEVLASYRKEAMVLLSRTNVYKELVRRIDSTKQSAQQVETGINDLDVLLNTTIPDVSVMERAAPPQAANRGRSFLFAFLLTGFFAIGVVVLMAIMEILQGKVKSVHDVSLLTGWKELGELPQKGDGITQQRVQSSLLSLFHLFNDREQDGKKIFCAEIGSETSAGMVLNCWQENFGVSGKKIFRLKCLPGSMRAAHELPARNKPASGIDQELICVEKFANRGIFCFSEDLFLAPAECELLKVDLELLCRNYDLIFIEYIKPFAAGEHLLEQFIEMSDTSLIFVRFNKVSKMLLSALSDTMQQLKQVRIWCILTDSKLPYWRP